MGKSFRFLLQFAWLNLSAIFGFAAIVIVGCYATGVPNSARASGAVFGLFENYYAMYPSMILMMLFLYAFALCTNNLNLGLSMGARRSDFFWAVQGNMLFYTAACWALYWFMSVFPAIAGWKAQRYFSLLGTYSGKLYLYPMLCMVLLVLGCLCGLVMVKNKILGTLLVSLSVIVMLGATVFMLLSAETGLLDFIYESEWAWLRSLPKVTAGVLAVSFAAGELLIWRVIQRCVVR